MRKIIHLSDLHVGHENCRRDFEIIAGNIIFEKEPGSRYVIVITGDLVDNANVDQYYTDVKEILKDLEDGGFRILVVPGNHDYGTGTKGNKKFVAKFKKVFFEDAAVTYPKLDIIEDVAFVGLDSTAGELNKYDKYLANGELGGKQLNHLETMLSSDEVKKCQRRVVYMHHHPFDPYPGYELKDSDQLKRVLEGKNIDALLYGHNHCFRLVTFWSKKCRNRNGKWGIHRCYDGGSATHKDDRGGVHRVIDFDRDPRWDYDGEFI